jgi:hypothetical protein
MLMHSTGYSNVQYCPGINSSRRAFRHRGSRLAWQRDATRQDCINAARTSVAGRPASGAPDTIAGAVNEHQRQTHRRPAFSGPSVLGCPYAGRWARSHVLSDRAHRREQGNRVFVRGRRRAGRGRRYGARTLRRARHRASAPRWRQGAV